MDLYLADVPQGLTRRARSFVQVHGLRVDSLKIDQYRDGWLALGIPAREVDRVAEYSARWGGVVLPPAPHYDGGPRILCPDTPEGSPAEGWWFEAGMQRTAVPYSFMIGPGGEFGVHGDRWVPLHATVEGWVESVALAYHAAMYAKKVVKVVADEVEAIRLEGHEPVQEVAGLADTWWRGPDSLVAVYRGEAECLSAPVCRTAFVYTGLDRWGLHG
ncbi:hypothetical protein [Streptosporangium lutulentum]|uniref:Uncharacterized protein n=1 Tax=Streptosporangium lutulentum TaxID=1461250 RepID=A0ABT9QJQ6_9ACTN|nr:hypothetical protein [Streptosporangium lutulentum]MDP9846987.1 hypothetical protein [Streptosporangium lutulentum]